ncbi:long-chain fatty acid transport protein 6-like [Ptychodera flava]|uniref:long-chain fatty acid transport protein 6-like n=1 Tax=Ptychodera flava TaxID=63121 RepID=UPI00396A1C20
MASPDVSKGLKIAAGTVATAGILNYVYPYWGHDFNILKFGIGVLSTVRKNVEQKRFVVDIFMDKVARHPYKAFIIYENTIYTYGDIDRMSNRFANFVRQQGLNSGDSIAMLMHNEPAFMWMYFGFAKLGISCAFINYNLRGESITHCLDVCGAKLMVVGQGSELQQAAQDVSTQIRERNVDIWSFHGDSQGFFRDVRDEIMQSPDDPIPKEARGVHDENSISTFIFTSGTTGHPKASKISHFRHMMSCYILTHQGVTPEDRMYISLPLFHSSGFVIGMCLAIEVGMTVILAKKFSVHNYWDDCKRHNATIMLYIGEVCRYLLTLPESPEDKSHSVRIAIGNGLRPDIWSKFKNRYGIAQITEFYGATEGPFIAINNDNTVGAVGKYSPFLKRVFGFELIKYDFETAEPIRNKSGRCIPVKRGEIGLLIVPINERAHFDGYSGNKKLTEKKIVRNAFKDGDQFVNMGDLMVLDKNYYMYFVDRIGDTFRWKGENVATTEVSEIISTHSAIKEANVYGVNIPGQDGRAGMAAMVLADGENFDPKSFYDHVTSSLPTYACPRFLRMMKTLETTGTYKYKKADLVKQGFNPNEVPETLYYMDMASSTYKPLDNSSYLHIVAGKAKL